MTPAQQTAMASLEERKAEWRTEQARMAPPISATLTRCRNNQALVELTSQPFNGLEMRPDDLRRMAQQLTAIADMAARLPLGGKHWKPTLVEVGGEPRQFTNEHPLDQLMSGLLQDIQTRKA